MKLLYWTITLLALFISLVACFDKLDHSLFEIHDELRKQEGSEADFYKLLKVSSNSRVEKITRAYRKISKSVHPDKDRSSMATKRFALYSNVHNVLKDYAARKRYDHYYKNGFPAWRGTDYMYNRTRPGLIFVIFFLFAMSNLTHYIILRVNHFRTKDRVTYILDEHKKTLNSRDLRKLEEQLNRGPSTPADEDILPREFDLQLLKEPTVYDVFFVKFTMGLLGKSAPVQASQSKKD